jgi:hypothetical protein
MQEVLEESLDSGNAPLLVWLGLEMTRVVRLVLTVATNNRSS